MKSSPPKRVKAHCPDCGPNRWALVKGYHLDRWSDEDAMIWTSTSHYILECPACEKVYHQTNRIFSEDFSYSYDRATGEHIEEYNENIEHWPPPSQRERPEWFKKSQLLDDDLEKLLNEVYKALDADLMVLASIGIRTVFDRASELLGVDPGRTFNAKLSELLNVGKISAGEKDNLSILTDAGSAAAHRGWRPSVQQLATMMDIIEPFLHRNFILPDSAGKLKSAVPARPLKNLPKPNTSNDQT